MIPQAFTTRDMSEAFKWLQTLPESVREEMKSMEQVVSLYLRAKRLGQGLPTMEQLSKVEHHSRTEQLSKVEQLSKHDHLAKVEQLSKIETTKSSQEFQQTLKDLRQELEQFDAANTPDVPTPTAINNHFQASQQKQSSEPVTQSADASLHSLKLDPKSRQIVEQIREGLNLSSDMEVIRMCLVLGQRHLRDVLK